jgi:antirestriction protein
VWIGSLGAYNSGHLIGRWVDATDVDELREAQEGVQREAVAKVGPLEAGDEFALMDREGFGDLIGEYEQLDRVARIGALIEKHGDEYIAWAEDADDPLDEARFEEAKAGHWDSDRAFAEEWAESTGAVKEDSECARCGNAAGEVRWPYNCIDWDRATEELMEGFHSVDAPGGGVFVFYRC